MTPPTTHRPVLRLPGFRRALPLALVALALAACGKEDPEEATVRPAVAEPEVPRAFVPRADGLLSEEQVSRFLLAHEALARVNDLYLDSLMQAPPERQRSAQQALDLARDKATRKFGLAGYAEYRWILEDAPRHPENLRLLERMNVKTVAP